jgi:uncharacterized protein YggT (Ycf19 family)
MATREHVTIDESERLRRHEAVKDDVRKQVHDDIRREADRVPVDPARERAAAEHIKREALDEVASTERDIARGRTAARGSQIIDYLFYLVYGIITLAIVLEAIGARESAGFKQFVDAMAAPLVAPFRGIMNDPAVGTYQFMLSYVVALIAYVLLHMAINGLLRLFAERKTAV